MISFLLYALAAIVVAYVFIKTIIKLFWFYIMLVIIGILCCIYVKFFHEKPSTQVGCNIVQTQEYL
ncbi:hypothetical protein SAMN05216537_11934 [Lachnospira multipara]|uniref:Uncharacterized protein n=1 Tax=Lachnospira multipara TaxID=28051 RepID=A0A1H5WY26_9FIRM|nr:hypothetical protein SAMN05216537_11934 [Lachnospira multipara]